ncbi:MAG: alpha-xylosidase [Lachnospiraceae bacterium]|jgi:alpha-D-xyloside xylohydrolase|nr:alpha-xylosidase [Lachnospiraceae bacterium]MCH4064964.1 alpha-xylosidase [Lachnospiraceae bacterium]MCH4103940.1 alpha-xylosidase [Lachnospiraceae bacterium]
MKFTNGYWAVRDYIVPQYAAEYAEHQFDGKTLTVYAPVKHIAGRGDKLNIGIITITLTSPMDNIIRVGLTHFAGTIEKGPFAEVHETLPQVEIAENEEAVIFQSGTTRAVISKVPGRFGIRFYDAAAENTEAAGSKSAAACRTAAEAADSRHYGRELTGNGWRTTGRMLDTRDNTSYMAEALDIDVDETIYGFGERFTPFVKNGQVISMWNEDGGTASEIAYKNIPFYITNKGYGVLVDNQGDVQFEVASEKVEKIQFSAKGESLGYYFINGHTPKGTISLYTELTGKPALPPAWTFGLWLTTSFTTNYDEATTSNFIQGMADRDIPLHVFHFDCYWMDAYEWCNFKWDPKTFPDPKGMLKRYHDRGLHICVWINPYIGQKSPLFKEGMEHGYLLKKTDGSVWQTDLWQPGMGIVDFTNPDATAWYQSKLKTLLDMGVDCFKTDFGERIPVKDIAWFDGSDPLKMHNTFTLLYNRAVFTLLEKERGKGEAALFARSATVGGQQYPVHWGGDSTATYQSMAETLRAGLSLACAGFGFWSHDISGFESTAPADIYKRWCQFGLLSSHSRLHGSSSYRVPWLFDEEACDVLRKFVKLKCSLMPYLYSKAAEAHEQGIPMMRPMFVEFPDDPTCAYLDRQYMLGDSLLVAPIFKASGEVRYYLPEGRWYNLLTEKQYEGGRWYKETFDYMSMPLLVREGTILAIGSENERPDYDYTRDTTFLLVNFKDGASARIQIPDLKGHTVLTVSASCKDEKVLVHLDGNAENPKFTVIGGDAREVEVQ